MNKNRKKHVKKVSPEFGKIIKQKRKELGYSLKRVAKAVEFDDSYICRIENHKRKNPSIFIIYGLAEVLEIDAGYLLKVAFPKE